jgi:hypothetical protein
MLMDAGRTTHLIETAWCYASAEAQKKRGGIEPPLEVCTASEDQK